MRIWLINNYNMLPKHGQLNRNYYFGKYLKKMGHEPVAFVGSHPHNTNIQLIKGKEKFSIYQKKPFPWVLIKTRNYEKSKRQRVISMFEFYFNMKIAAKHFKKPDAIVGSSAHPLAALVAIRLAKKNGCKSVVEIRDLWPESIVEYGIANRRNPLIKMLYAFEKYLYIHADELIFTMENAWRYFEEKGLDKFIPRKKVHYINNGIDIDFYNKCKENYQVMDRELDNADIFKVVYTGSIRKVNNLGLLLDVAKRIKNNKIMFLIWGDGEEKTELEKRVKEESIGNVIFKGRVEKKFIPYIVSKADLNIVHNTPSPLFRFGISPNKMFDYLASGRPILLDFACKYNPAVQAGAGLDVNKPSPELIAEEIEKIFYMDKDSYNKMCLNALEAAKEYDYKLLSKKLVEILE